MNLNPPTLALCALALAACGPTSNEADDFRHAVPTSDAVALKVPGGGSTGQGRTSSSGPSTRRDGLEGQTAVMYSFTRGATVVVNTGVGLTLDLVSRIVDSPPTSLTADSAVWGPVTDALSPNTWKLTVQQTPGAKATFTYKLEARAKTEPDSAYRVVLSGTHVDLERDQFGQGSFTLDWDAAQQLPEHDGNVGRAEVRYARPSATANTTIDAVFTNVRDGDTGGLVSSTYGYVSTPGQGGSLDFSAKKNVVEGPALETITVKSRWQQSGAGRSDVVISAGDLTVDATLNECWDTNFLSRYLLASYTTLGNYGTPGACAFATAQYATK